MGKPRMIILIRHAQSEGNKNRDIHQFIPDHRVKLTPEGWSQAEDAGRRLRELLRPDDTLQFFTSPYRRTRETTEGILRSLTSDEPTPSPFPRHKIKVFEEPRLREQDFGNFQPCSAEMERMWQERADYGHFFYRIPNGESAADAYDRVAGFNETMWRLFGEADFPSVCVLVTHGLMTRVFLMKWYHWSVEYFEDLRNINHCEFILMKQNPDNGKYVLQNKLRTWSDLKRRTGTATPSLDTKVPPLKSASPAYGTSPTIPARRWGGCVNGCNHAHINFPRRTRRQNTADITLPNSSIAEHERKKEDTPLAPRVADLIINSTTDVAGVDSASPVPIARPSSTPGDINLGHHHAHHNASDADDDADETSDIEVANNFPDNHHHEGHQHRHIFSSISSLTRHLHPGRDFGGSRSGAATPAEGFSDDSDYSFPDRHSDGRPGTRDGPNSAANTTAAPTSQEITSRPSPHPVSRPRSSGKSTPNRSARSVERERDLRRRTVEEWEAESGMGQGKRAEKLGDGGSVQGYESGEREAGLEEEDVEDAKSRSRKGFGEVY